jgi:hypothetical protein
MHTGTAMLVASASEVLAPATMLNRTIRRAGGVRGLTRHAAAGITRAFGRRSSNNKEPHVVAADARRTPRGILHTGEDELARPPDLQGRILRALGAPELSSRAEALAEAVARGALRGACEELRSELGESGNGPLARALTGALRHGTSELARGSVSALSLCGALVAAAAILRAARPG